MKTFKICSSETIFYEVKVKAESLQEAGKMVQNGEVKLTTNDIVDSCDFEIDIDHSTEINL